MFSTDDTIVAIATPPGRGGIGIVRISGPDAAAVARRMLAAREALTPRHATFTRVVGVDEHPASSAEFQRGGPLSTRDAEGSSEAGDGELREKGDVAPRRAIDQVVATLFPAPHSYTGENVVEISAHGSPVVLRAIVRTAVAAGARMAGPGEFTFRAFLNGRIDLVQAEAVVDLVDAVTPAQARAAFDQLEGTLTAAIARIDAALFDLIARLEASIDFPEEGYHFATPAQTRAELDRIAESVDELVRDGRRGRLIREGRQVVIAGKPNVGKSTLFNCLLGSERAIVTEVAGTTRDLVSETADIDGVRVALVDTAGVRQSDNDIEREGVRRARRAADVADLVVLVLDRARALDAEDRTLLDATAGRARLVVANKCDLPAAWATASIDADVLAVSLLDARDVNILKQRLAETLGNDEPLRDPPTVTNARHLDLLARASAAIDRARVALAESDGRIPEEFLLSDLAEGRAALEEVTGRRTSEDVLRHIFSRFCIGK